MKSLELLCDVVRFLGWWWMMWKVITGWEGCDVSRRAAAGLVLVETVDTSKKRFRHVWLV